VASALGRVTFTDVLAVDNVPNWPRAKVDGYAICSADTLQATPRQPWQPTWVFERDMPVKPDWDHEPFNYVLPPGHVINVKKGWPLPKGADAVLPLLRPELRAYFSDNSALKIKRPIPPGWFTAAVGEDYPARAPLLPAGIRLRPEHISLLWRAGLREIEVVRRPRVAVVYGGGQLNADSEALTLPLQLMLQQLGHASVPVLHLPVPRTHTSTSAYRQDMEKWLPDFDLFISVVPPTSFSLRGSVPTPGVRDWYSHLGDNLSIGSTTPRSPTIRVPFQRITAHGPVFGNDYLEDHGVWLTFGEFTPDSLLFMEIVLPHLLDAMEHADYHGRDWQTLPCALPFTRLGQWRCNVRRQVLCWAAVKETHQGERLLFPLEAPWYGSFKPLAEANAIVALPMNNAVIPLGEPLPHMLLSNAALPQVSEEDLARIEAAKAALAAEQARRAELAALPPLPMTQAWAQLEAWLKQEEPTLLRSLGKPASPEALAELEAKLKLSLPDDFKAALSVHDGQKGEEPLFEGEFFLSAKGVLSKWRTWTKLMKSPDMAECSGAPDEGIRPDWFHPAWIPFTHDGMGNHLCLDLAPADGGQAGQIIRVWHDEDERQLIAPSFAVWFSSFVRSLPNEDEAAPGAMDSAG
jgi:cell wall assembly regulator SMI1